ncbi:LysM domain-containing protein [Candidatus Halobeggiatoa sp. HSG11]|nr:LysM domain-containing protein [Candidatus Halobeggiatoa sp. HSG11]
MKSNLKLCFLLSSLVLFQACNHQPSNGIFSFRPSSYHHTVQKGDTLCGIARQHGHNNINSILEWNQFIENPDLISIGWVISIPEPNYITYHRVRAGEDLSYIVRQYCLKPEELLAWNGLGGPYHIYPGQILRVTQPNFMW